MKTEQEIQIEKLKKKVKSQEAKLKQIRFALGDWNYKQLLKWKPNETDLKIFKENGRRLD